MYRTIAIALIVLMAASTADAKLFGRRSRSNSGGGYQSFPANTPPAPANCPGGVCVNPLTVPTTTPVIPAQVEMSVVVEQSTIDEGVPDNIDEIREDIIAEAEAAIALHRRRHARSNESFEREIAKEEAIVAQMRLEQERRAAIEAIQQRAENQMKWLSIEHTIEDLQAELPQTGGDPKDETQ